jgi:hypothetical protein
MKPKKLIYAVVDLAFDSDWTQYFRWADSETRDFCIHGKFKTEEEAVANIPPSFKVIVIQYGDVNKTLTR